LIPIWFAIDVLLADLESHRLIDGKTGADFQSSVVVIFVSFERVNKAGKFLV